MISSSQNIYVALNTRAAGLTEAEAKEHLHSFGPNELKRVKRFRLLRLFLLQFANMFLLLLLFASLVSWFTGSASEAMIIAVIVLANALISFMQEYRAELSLKSMQKMMAPLTVALREGHLRKIPAGQVVPGDIIHLEAGDRVPADGVIIESFNVTVNESSLTGESIPVAKKSVVSPLQIADDEKVFAATTVSYGRLHFIVTHTGMNTRVGSIARITTDITPEKSPLQYELDLIGKRIVWAAVIICALVFLVFAVKNDFALASFKASFLFAIALAVAIVPEGLPATVTIGLTFGMRKMAKKGAIICKLSAVETLGCTTVICTDKTGTLTKNEMTVRQIYTNRRFLHLSGIGFETEGEFVDEHGTLMNPAKDSAILRFLELGVLCNNATYSAHNAVGDPTELAMLVAALKGRIDLEALRRRFPRIDELPFDSTRRMMSTVHQREVQGTILSATKGAPDAILKKCTHFLDGSEIKPVNDDVRQQIIDARSHMASNALRVLAVAFKELNPFPVDYRSRIEEDMVFVGLVGMADPPRHDAAEAVRMCRQAGIRVIMTTGDQKETALSVAREIGIISAADHQAIVGEQLRGMSDAQLDTALREILVFAQISPEDKMRVVEGLKRNREIVAMTGDGVNDAPALKRADIGVAMGRSGTDIAKDASEMVISDDSFSTIVAAVLEGRAIYDNVRKFILYAFSGIAAEFLVVMFSLLPGVRQLLTAIQILWIDLGTEVLPALTLSFDPPASDVMSRKPRQRQDRLIGKAILLRVMRNSLIIASGSIILFFLYRQLGTPEKALTMPFASIIMFQMVNIFTCRNLSKTTLPISIISNPYLLGAVGVSLLATVFLVSLPFTAGLFRITPLAPVDWLIIASVAMAIIGFNYIRKNFERACSANFA